MSERKNWTRQEDSILKKLKQDFKDKKWNQISKILEIQHGITERTGKQCRERYENHLKDDIFKGPWIPQEEEKLLDLHVQYGNKWVNIANQINKQKFIRTGNDAKNYFISVLKKSLKNLNSIISSKKIKNKMRPIPLTFITKLLKYSVSKLFQQQINSTKIALVLAKEIEVDLRIFHKMQDSQSLSEKAEKLYRKIQKFKSLIRKNRSINPANYQELSPHAIKFQKNDIAQSKDKKCLKQNSENDTHKQFIKKQESQMLKENFLNYLQILERPQRIDHPSDSLNVFLKQQSNHQNSLLYSPRFLELDDILY